MQPPGPLEPTRTFTIPRPDATLHAEWFAPAGTPKGLVVVTHGYAEHCGRYHEVANVLVRAGAAVVTYDCRGHGKSTGARGHCDRFEQFLDDLDAAIAWGRGACTEAGNSDPKLLLLGHSHGSLITLRSLVDPARPHTATAAVVSSPWLELKMKVSSAKRFVGNVLARVYPRASMQTGIVYEALTSDPAKLAERRADKLCNDVFTAGWARVAQEAQAYVYEHADAIRTPTQWLVAGGDQIADPVRSRAVADRVRHATVEYHDLAGQQHEVFNETKRGDTFDLLTRFVGQHLP